MDVPRQPGRTTGARRCAQQPVGAGKGQFVCECGIGLSVLKGGGFGIFSSDLIYSGIPAIRGLELKRASVPQMGSPNFKENS